MGKPKIPKKTFDINSFKEEFKIRKRNITKKFDSRLDHYKAREKKLGFCAKISNFCTKHCKTPNEENDTLKVLDELWSLYTGEEQIDLNIAKTGEVKIEINNENIKMKYDILRKFDHKKDRSISDKMMMLQLIHSADKLKEENKKLRENDDDDQCSVCSMKMSTHYKRRKRKKFNAMSTSNISRQGWWPIHKMEHCTTCGTRVTTRTNACHACVKHDAFGHSI